MSDRTTGISTETKVAVSLAVIEAEYVRARQKFAPLNSGHEGWAVIKEELDELWALIKANKGTTVEAYDEAKQVAAMALAYMVEVAGGD